MRKVIVTGCRSGFGRQVSERLARKGHRVFATMRDVGGRNRDTPWRCRCWRPPRASTSRCSISTSTSTASVDAAAAAVRSHGGAPDVVISNAGQMFVGLGEAFTSEELTTQLDVNIVGVHRVAARNAAVEAHDIGLFEAAGLTAFATLKT